MTTLIKICGIGDRRTLDAAVAAGADYVGFVHHQPSPRHVELERAAELAEALPDHVRPIVLLVNPDWHGIAAAAVVARPHAIQFHGRETPEATEAVPKAFGVAAWKGFGVRDRHQIDGARKFAGKVERLIYDAPARPGQPGGTGIAVDWELIATVEHPAPWALAGGLTPENVGEALRITRAPMVDVSSGVESAPGVKDVDRIAAFCDAVRAYDRARSAS